MCPIERQEDKILGPFDLPRSLAKPHIPIWAPSRTKMAAQTATIDFATVHEPPPNGFQRQATGRREAMYVS
jgi:hypothetical protein